MNEISYSVVIPIYRSEEYISKLTDDIVSFFLINSYSFEIIFVADAPIDNSWESILNIKLKYQGFIKAVLLENNVGQHSATLEGFKLAKGDFVITIDEDGQHDPSTFNLLINKQKLTNADVVYGSFKKRNHSLFRNSASLISKMVFKICIPNFFWQYTSFRLINFETIKKILAANVSYKFIDGMIFLNTTKISDELVHHSKDYTGKSAYSKKALLKHFLKIILNYRFKKN